MNKLRLILALALLLCGTARADYIDAIEEGNQALQSGDFQTALEQYHIAEADIPESPELSYNIGLALYEQGDYEKAAERFTKAVESDESNLAAQAHYNLGNTKFQQQDYTGAIESYKRSLELNPDDLDAKYNLELARKMLKENSEQQQQDQQQQQQQNQDQQEQDQQQQQQQQQEGQEKQDQQEQQGQQGEPKDDQEEQQEGQQLQPDDSKPMSKEDAERILNALKDDERDVQKKLKRVMTQSDYNGKDW